TQASATPAAHRTKTPNLDAVDATAPGTRHRRRPTTRASRYWLQLASPARPPPTPTTPRALTLPTHHAQHARLRGQIGLDPCQQLRHQVVMDPDLGQQTVRHRLAHRA